MAFNSLSPAVGDTVVRCHYSASADRRGCSSNGVIEMWLMSYTTRFKQRSTRSFIFDLTVFMSYAVSSGSSPPNIEILRVGLTVGPPGIKWPGRPGRPVDRVSMQSSHCSLHFSHAPIYRPDLEEQAYSRPFDVVGVYHTTTNPALRICSWWEHRDIEAKSTGDRF
jgi:hypothetical protein